MSGHRTVSLFAAIVLLSMVAVGHASFIRPVVTRVVHYQALPARHVVRHVHVHEPPVRVVRYFAPHHPLPLPLPLPVEEILPGPAHLDYLWKRK